MTEDNILFRFAKVGINLEPKAYEIIKEKYDNEKYKNEYLDMIIAIAIYDRKVNNNDKSLFGYEKEAIKWVR